MTLDTYDTFLGGHYEQQFNRPPYLDRLRHFIAEGSHDERRRMERRVPLLRRARSVYGLAECSKAGLVVSDV